MVTKLKKVGYCRYITVGTKLDENQKTKTKTKTLVLPTLVESM
jgi:hypothetical protein